LGVEAREVEAAGFLCWRRFLSAALAREAGFFFGEQGVFLGLFAGGFSLLGCCCVPVRRCG